MKLSAFFFFSALVLPSNSQDTPLLRGLERGSGGGGGGDGRGGGRGGGGGKGGGGGRGKKGKNMIAMMVKANCYWGANESQPLLDRIEEECATNDPCDGVDLGELDDTCADPSWATMDDEDLMIEGCPDGGLTEQEKEELKAKMQAKKEMRMGMSRAERIEYKEEMEALKANNTATTLLCGCCKGTESIVTPVKDREGAVAKTLGFRRPKRDSDGEDEDNSDSPGED